MPRDVAVSPWVWIEGNQWTYTLTVTDLAANTASTFTHTETAGVTSSEMLTLLDLWVTIRIGDSDTDQDVDDAFYVDDIRPGPQTETVWSNWRDRAESIIAGMNPGNKNREFHEEWGPNDTASMRQDAGSAIAGRGWTVLRVHWHEGDRTVGYA